MSDRAVSGPAVSGPAVEMVSGPPAGGVLALRHAVFVAEQGMPADPDEPAGEILASVAVWVRSGGARLWSDTRFIDAHRLYGRLGYPATGARRDLHDRSASTEIEFCRVLPALRGLLRE